VFGAIYIECVTTDYRDQTENPNSMNLKIVLNLKIVGNFKIPLNSKNKFVAMSYNMTLWKTSSTCKPANRIKVRREQHYIVLYYIIY